MIPQLRAAIAGLDPTLPVFGVTTMADAVSSGFSTSRMAARMAGFFGVLALLIASVGLYAVVAMSVSERTREMGLRLALGAPPRGIVRHLMTSGARLGAIGLVIGLIGAVAVARAMGGLFFGRRRAIPSRSSVCRWCSRSSSWRPRGCRRGGRHGSSRGARCGATDRRDSRRAKRDSVARRTGSPPVRA